MDSTASDELIQEIAALRQLVQEQNEILKRLVEEIAAR
jgi:hypothetical protein